MRIILTLSDRCSIVSGSLSVYVFAPYELTSRRNTMYNGYVNTDVRRKDNDNK